MAVTRRPQLSDEVAAHLRGLIMSGRMRPGERVRLEEMAEQLGVSITPVREALLTLRGEDMVELEPRRGYVVAPLSKQDILDVFTLQGDIAGELAARAASRLTGAAACRAVHSRRQAGAGHPGPPGRRHRARGVRVPPRDQPARRGTQALLAAAHGDPVHAGPAALVRSGLAHHDAHRPRGAARRVRRP